MTTAEVIEFRLVASDCFFDKFPSFSIDDSFNVTSEIYSHLHCCWADIGYTKFSKMQFSGRRIKFAIVGPSYYKRCQ